MINDELAGFKIAVGAYMDLPGSVLNLSIVLKEKYGHHTEIKRLGKADGPNDFVQIILDSKSSALFAAVFLAPFFHGYLTKLGENAADFTLLVFKRFGSKLAEIFKNSDEHECLEFIQNFSSCVLQSQHGGNSFILSIEHKNINSWRNIGIEIPKIENASSEAEMLKISHAFIAINLLYEHLINTVSGYQNVRFEPKFQNSDGSGKIQLNEDGSTITEFILFKDSKIIDCYYKIIIDTIGNVSIDTDFHL